MHGNLGTFESHRELESMIANYITSEKNKYKFDNNKWNGTCKVCCFNRSLKIDLRESMESWESKKVWKVEKM